MEGANTSCEKLPVNMLLKIALTYSITGGIGILVASTILIGLLYVRAYKSVLQRLFIYSVLSVLVQDSCQFANIMEYHHKPNATELEDSTGCAWLGFISNWSGWTEYMFYLVIILYLLGIVCVQVKGSILEILRRSRALRVSVEVGVVLVSVFGPGLVMWKPLYDQKYGLDRGSCFIKCNETSNSYFIYVFFYSFFGYELVTLFCVFIALGLLVLYSVLSSKLHRAKLMIKYLAVLLTAIIVNSVILNIILVIYTTSPIGHKLRFFSAVFATVDDFVFLSGYLLVFHSSKLSTLLKKFATRKKKLSEGNDYGTYKESNQRTVPSYTYYDVSYTGEFTTVENIA